MTESEIEQRTKTFALRLLRPRSAWPRAVEADLLRRQSVRAGTAVAAGYRAACGAKSTAESETLSAARVGERLVEANEITVTVVASQRTVRDRKPIKNLDSKIINPK